MADIFSGKFEWRMNKSTVPFSFQSTAAITNQNRQKIPCHRNCTRITHTTQIMNVQCRTFITAHDRKTVNAKYECKLIHKSHDTRLHVLYSHYYYIYILPSNSQQSLLSMRFIVVKYSMFRGLSTCDVHGNKCRYRASCAEASTATDTAVRNRSVSAIIYDALCEIQHNKLYINAQFSSGRLPVAIGIREQNQQFTG